MKKAGIAFGLSAFGFVTCTVFVLIIDIQSIDLGPTSDRLEQLRLWECNHPPNQADIQEWFDKIDNDINDDSVEIVFNESNQCAFEYWSRVHSPFFGNAHADFIANNVMRIDIYYIMDQSLTMFDKPTLSILILYEENRTILIDAFHDQLRIFKNSQ